MTILRRNRRENHKYKIYLGDLRRSVEILLFVDLRRFQEAWDPAIAPKTKRTLQSMSYLKRWKKNCGKRSQPWDFLNIFLSTGF